MTTAAARGGRERRRSWPGGCGRNRWPRAAAWPARCGCTSACTSTRKQRVPSTATCTAAPAAGPPSPRNRPRGRRRRAGRRPVISKTPSSLVDPKRFLAARSVRKKRWRSPSNWSTVSTMCSSTRGPGDRALLGDVPDEEDGGAGLLGEAQEARRPPRAPGSTLPGAEVRASLYSVCTESTTTQRRAGGGDRLEDRLEVGLGQHGDAARVGADALGAHLDLGRRLLAADEQHVAAGRGDAVERLQQQRALADAGLAADQHERARHDAAAEHEVELGDAGREARRRPTRRRRHRRTGRGGGGRRRPRRSACPAGPPRSRRRRRRRALR